MESLQSSCQFARFQYGRGSVGGCRRARKTSQPSQFRMSNSYPMIGKNMGCAQYNN